MKLQRLMNGISEWSDRTFGPTERNPAILHHLKKEVDELIDAFNKREMGFYDFEELRMEYADCFMLILDSAAHAGLSARDIIDATSEKLEINKRRQWGQPDKNGVVEHIK